MAVLARVNWTAQQRVDLNHLLSQESFLAFDFRSLLTGLSGSVNPYILKGYEVTGKTGLTVSIAVAKSLVFNPLDGNGSFFAGGDNDAPVLVDLPADQENIFVQVRFLNETRAPVNTAFWDPLALSGDGDAGTEFSASTNTQNVITLQIESNTVGFDEDAIPIMRASTSASAVTEMVDARRMMFRLGSGGPTPNPLNKFAWSNTRAEPVAAGTGVGDEVNSPFRSRDSSGVRNDKGISTLKEWMDAVMTRLSEIAGQSLWYDNSSSSGAVGGLNLNTLFIDTIGHNIQADANTTLKWSRVGGNLVLQSFGQSSVKWQFNYGMVQWELGGTFVNNTAGGSRAYSDVKFTSGTPVDNGNIYLLIEREVPKGSGAAVRWGNYSADENLIETQAISGVTGDFVGIAIGDYIRKESEGIQRYYRIVRMSDSNNIFSAPDLIADSSIVALEVERPIDGVTTEPLRYWRAKYSNADIVADSVIGEYPSQDTAFYWLGRRQGNLFQFRDYGTMQEGEEVPVLNDAFIGIQGSGGGDLMIEHGHGAVLDSVNGYSQDGSALGEMLTIRRRKRDNTVETPSSGDNSGAYLTYTLASPVGALAVGDTLWVKLDDSAGGALSSGSVADNSPDNEDNTNTVTNVWEVRPAATTPLRDYDNRDVYPIARCVEIETPAGTISALVFLDGSVLTQDGITINTGFATTGVTRFYNNDVHLMARSPQAVLFIDDTVPGRIDEDVTQFFYDKPNQILGAFNYRIGPNIIALDSPEDQDLFPNLGAHNLDVGSSDSTVRIRGDLVVLGATVSMQVSTIQSDDKLITLGVGNAANASGGSGIEVADNTVEIQDATTVSGDPNLSLTFPAPHTFVVGDDIGISSNTDINGILSAQMTGSYRIVSSATLPGQAEIIDASTILVITLGTADTSGTVTLTPPVSSIRAFDTLSWVKLTDSSGTDGGMTSWSFKVKGEPQIVSLTPISGYGTIPTANHSAMQAGRIPFTGTDAAGDGGSDTTFDFTSGLAWDSVNGALVLGGNLIPEADNTYMIGTPAMRWASVHAGPSGYTVHDDTADTQKLQIGYIGGVPTIATLPSTDLDFVGRDIRFYAGAASNLTATVRRNGTFNITPISTVPSSPVPLVGDMWMDATDGSRLRYHDGIDFISADRADITRNVTGLEDRTSTTLSFNDVTRTFTLAPTGASYDFYTHGTRRRATARSRVIPNVSGWYYIYLLGSDLIATTVWSESLYRDVVLVGAVYWNATTSTHSALHDLRRSISTPWTTNAYLSKTQGLRWETGFDITSATGGDGSANSQAQIALTGGIVWDEGARNTIVDEAAPSAPFEQILSPVANIPVLYRVGSAWVKDAATTFPLKQGTARPQWNQLSGSWSAVDSAADGNYVVYWVFASNDFETPVVSIMGQEQYTTLDQASAAAYDKLDLSGLDASEYKLLYRLIFVTDSGFANTPKAVLAAVKDYRRAIDMTLSSSLMISNHGDLNGLANDDHTQYALLDGRSGGQTLYGGSGPGESLNLGSTSAPVKGSIVAQDTLMLLGGMRYNSTQTITSNYTLANTHLYVRVDTSARVADLDLTLPPADGSNQGQVLILKDIGMSLSLLNKRVNLIPQGADTIIGDVIYTNGSPLHWTIDGSSLTLRSDGNGRWDII